MTMNIYKSIPLILLFTILPIISYSQTALVKDGNDILQCQKNVENIDILNELEKNQVSYCIGMINGISNTLLALPETKKIVCLPSSVTAAQILKVTTKNLNDHPEKLHKSASYLIMESIIEAFPCK